MNDKMSFTYIFAKELFVYDLIVRFKFRIFISMKKYKTSCLNDKFK